jgi:hypothetical protein
VKNGELVADGVLLRICDEGRSLEMGISNNIYFTNFCCMRAYDKGGTVRGYTSCDFLDEMLTKKECLIGREDVLTSILSYTGIAFGRESGDYKMENIANAISVTE